MTGDAGSRRRVLVVDDEAFVLQMLVDMLTTFGYEVRSARTFDDARTEITSFSPHVIVLDLRMPGTSGLDGLAYLRAHHRTVPVIIVSGEVNQKAAEAVRAAGAFDVVAKPFDVKVLRELVGQAMRVAPPG
jgi:DNA-binding response OmpR family regulator